MPALDGLLHLQARVQAQILREDLRSVYGIFLRTTLGGCHEQTILMHSWWAEPGATFFRRSEEREYLSLVMMVFD